MNSDPSEIAIVHSDEIHWQASPSPSVWRKRFELRGSQEHGLVTSLVRYDAHSGFEAHDHPEGEEIFVVSGVLSDEYGSYEAGTYVLNPRGYSHRPYSTNGCVILCKLRQYAGKDRWRLRLDSRFGEWGELAPGVTTQELYNQPGYPETVELVRIQPGARLPASTYEGGVETYVLDGSFECPQGTMARASWMRLPPGARLELVSETGCHLYVKRNHLLAQDV